MKQVVIGIQRDTQGGLAARLLRGTANWPGALDLFPIQLTSLPDCDTNSNVMSYGQAVYQALSQQPAIAQEFARLAASPPTNDDALQFRIETPDAEEIRWETLCRPQGGFLAVNPGRRISRLAAASVLPTGPGARRFVPPLLFTGFLSAVGIPVGQELREICRQLEVAAAAGLPLAARLHIADQQLLGTPMPSNVELLPMPASADQLKAELKGRPPQFLHFFCHGGINLGVSTLDLATILDQDEFDATREKRSSIRLAVDELAMTLEGLQSVWLTVLNSCSGAAASRQFNSMAYRLAEQGSPVAVGWNEPVNGLDATHLTQSFYREVFNLVQRALRTAGPDDAAEIDLGPAILPVRQRFLELYGQAPPEAFGRWSMPVLYECAEPLRVQSVVDENMRARVNTVASALQAMPATTPLEVRQQVLQLLERDPVVPAPLRPDLFGMIPAPPSANEAAPAPEEHNG